MADCTKYIAGHYTATWDGSVVGETLSGFFIQVQDFVDPVRTEDNGDVQVDGVIRGSQATVTTTLTQWNQPAVAKLLWWINNAAEGTIANTGMLVCKHGFAKPLVLTPSYDDNNEKDIYTFPLTYPNNPRDFNLQNRLRTMRLSLIALPDATNRIYIPS